MSVSPEDSSMSCKTCATKYICGMSTASSTSAVVLNMVLVPMDSTAVTNTKSVPGHLRNRIVTVRKWLAFMCSEGFVDECYQSCWALERELHNHIFCDCIEGGNGIRIWVPISFTSMLATAAANHVGQLCLRYSHLNFCDNQFYERYFFSTRVWWVGTMTNSSAKLHSHRLNFGWATLWMVCTTWQNLIASLAIVLRVRELIVCCIYPLRRPVGRVFRRVMVTSWWQGRTSRKIIESTHTFCALHHPELESVRQKYVALWIVCWEFRTTLQN